MSDSGSTGYDIATGTFEEARAMVGHTSPVRFGAVAVNAAMIRHFAAMVRDGNAGLWDDELSSAVWGGIVVPRCQPRAPRANFPCPPSRER